MEHTFLLMPSISSSLFMLLLIMKLMLLLKTGKRFINYLLDPVLQIFMCPSYKLEVTICLPYVDPNLFQPKGYRFEFQIIIHGPIYRGIVYF